MFDKTIVTGIANNFSSESIGNLVSSPLANDVYYSGGFRVVAQGIVVEPGFLLSVTNDIDRYITSVSDGDYEIAYYEGFSPDCFNEGRNTPFVLVGETVAGALELAPGDSMDLLSLERANWLFRYHNDRNEAQAQTVAAQAAFTVAGVVSSDNKAVAEGIFAPISGATEHIGVFEDAPFPVEYAAFSLADKEDPHPLINLLDAGKQAETVYESPDDKARYYLELTELENTKRMRDMLAALFPVALTTAVLLGLCAPLLIILQSAKKSAILLILGTPKMRARMMLAAEQIGLCVAGLCFAGAALFLYDTGLFVDSRGTLALCAAAYLFACVFASAVSAWIVTRRRVLSLLQTKE
jgi:hypothetical protein